MEDEHLNVEAAAVTPAVDSVEEEQLVTKRNAVSTVWQCFGFKREDTAQKTVICKVCRNTVVTSQGNTSNLFHHLQYNHVVEFEEIKKAQSEKRSGGPAKSASRQQSLTEAFANTQQYE